jgi:hypothetical protein
MRKLVVSLVAVPVIASTVPVFAQESEFDVRARETEQQMTDDERFAMVISLSGATRFTGGVRDKRYPKDAPLTAGYTYGVPRLGVPALLSADASMGVTNPGFRPDDKDATAFRRRWLSVRASILNWRARAARRSPAKHAAGVSTSSSQVG